MCMCYLLSMENKSKFQITGNGTGYHMTFPNGWTVSVQWGKGNYCDHHHDEDENTHYAFSAEIAAWHFVDNNHVWHDFGCDTVKGWCDTKEVAEFMFMIAAK